jgi:hypothetical protein
MWFATAWYRAGRLLLFELFGPIQFGDIRLSRKQTMSRLLVVHADRETEEAGQSIRAVVEAVVVGMDLFTRDSSLFQACLYAR